MRLLRKALLQSLQDTSAFAAEVVLSFPKGSVLLLDGDLGAGKTTFVQRLAVALGVSRTVTSPTFVLANTYPAGDGTRLVHFDLYRLAMPEGVYDLGLEEALEAGDRVAIEWPERAQRVLDIECPRRLHLFLKKVGETERLAELYLEDVNDDGK